MTHRSLSMLLVVAMGGMTGLPVAADPDGPAAGTTSGWNDWRLLRLKARGVPLFSGSLTLDLAGAGPTRTFTSRTVARFCGATVSRSSSETTLDAKTGLPSRYTSSNRKRERRYRFESDRYVVEKWTPPTKRGAPPEEWELRSSAEYAYPLDAEGRPSPVLDPWGLLLYLRRLELRSVGDEAVVHVAGSGGIVPYRIRIAESRDSTRKVHDLANGGKRTVDGREVRLRILPADPENADEGFLNMEGEIELWVDASSMAPLDISGKIPHIPGKIRLAVDGLGTNRP